MAGETFSAMLREPETWKSFSARDRDQNSHPSKWVGVGVVLLTPAIFVLDLATGRGYAEGVLYVAPILLSLWTKQLRTTQVLAVVCPLLVISGYFFSDNNVSVQSGVTGLPISNRLYAFSMVTAAAVIAWQRKRSLMELQQAHDELDGRVQSRLLQTLMRAISTSPDFEAAMESTLANVCATFGWDYAEAWVPRTDEGVLECNSAFVASPELEPFRRVRGELKLPAGMGLPGRVWSSKKPQWILDLAKDAELVVRADVAADLGLTAGVSVPVMVPATHGLKSALGLPILAEDVVQVILTFFMRRKPWNRDLKSVVHLLSLVGSQLGALVHRKRNDAGLREKYQELQQKSEGMEQFVHTVSHDLKSPLVTIGGMLGLLKEELQEGRLVDAGEIIATAEDTVARMKGLIDDLLMFSRIGRVPDALHPVELRPLIERVLRTHRARLNEKGVAVDLSLGVPTVRAEPTRLVQLLENLIVNALKYASDGPAPRLEIGSEIANGEVWLFVKDNGPGIEPRQHDRVFDLFEQLDANSEGSGVGLAIVRRIMEAHRGRTWVESTPGEGATFRLAFPAQISEVVLSQ